MTLHAAAYEKGEGLPVSGSPSPLFSPQRGSGFFGFSNGFHVRPRGFCWARVRAGFVQHALNKVDFIQRASTPSGVKMSMSFCNSAMPPFSA